MTSKKKSTPKKRRKPIVIDLTDPKWADLRGQLANVGPVSDAEAAAFMRWLVKGGPVPPMLWAVMGTPPGVPPLPELRAEQERRLQVAWEDHRRHPWVIGKPAPKAVKRWGAMLRELRAAMPPDEFDRMWSRVVHSHDRPLTDKDNPAIDEMVLDAIDGCTPPAELSTILIVLGDSSASLSGERIIIVWDDDEKETRRTVLASIGRLRKAGHVKLVGRKYALTAAGERRLRELRRVKAHVKSAPKGGRS
jgi:hypothetical protein